jgi:hypothetical protein
MGDRDRLVGHPLQTPIPLLIHGVEEFSIVLSRLHLLQKKFHTLHGVHRLKDFSQEPDTVEIVTV